MGVGGLRGVVVVVWGFVGGGQMCGCVVSVVFLVWGWMGGIVVVWGFVVCGGGGVYVVVGFWLCSGVGVGGKVVVCGFVCVWERGDAGGRVCVWPQYPMPVGGAGARTGGDLPKYCKQCPIELFLWKEVCRCAV